MFNLILHFSCGHFRQGTARILHETERLSRAVPHVWQQLQPDFEGTEEPFFRAQGNGADLQTGEVHAATRGDCNEDSGTYK